MVVHLDSFWNRGKNQLRLTYRHGSWLKFGTSSLGRSFECAQSPYWSILKHATFSNHSEQTCIVFNQSEAKPKQSSIGLYAWRVFPRLASAACCCLEFWLAHCVIWVSCDWPGVITSLGSCSEAQNKDCGSQEHITPEPLSMLINDNSVVTPLAIFRNVFPQKDFRVRPRTIVIIRGNDIPPF